MVTQRYTRSARVSRVLIEYHRSLDIRRLGHMVPGMDRHGSDREGHGEAGLGDAQSSNPPDDDAMIETDADPLDTDVEDADLFLGDGDEEYEETEEEADEPG